MIVAKASEIDPFFGQKEGGYLSWYRRFLKRRNFTIRRVTKSNMPSRFRNVGELIEDCKKFLTLFEQSMTEN